MPSFYIINVKICTSTSYIVSGKCSISKISVRLLQVWSSTSVMGSRTRSWRTPQCRHQLRYQLWLLNRLLWIAQLSLLHRRRPSIRITGIYLKENAPTTTTRTCTETMSKLSYVFYRVTKFCGNGKIHNKYSNIENFLFFLISQKYRLFITATIF